MLSKQAVAAFDELCEILRPVRLTGNTFRGEPPSVEWGVPFGGLLVAQALAAASATVPEGLWIRSLHAYFIEVGRADQAVDIHVDHVHDGRSTSWRSAKLQQNDRLLLKADMMFSRDSTGLHHQDPMPAAPSPEDLVNVGLALESHDDAFRPWNADSPFDLRYVADPPRIAAASSNHSASSAVWFKANGTSDDRALNAALLAYASDMCMLDSCLRPHRLWFGPTSASGFSLDHSMWFHAPARIDEWILHDQRSPVMENGRGLALGRMFTQSGELLCSVAQLGSIRTTRP